MIITKLIGGLGTQMFQYVSGRRIQILVIITTWNREKKVKNE